MQADEACMLADNDCRRIPYGHVGDYNKRYFHAAPQSSFLLRNRHPN
jgi:hypothetical protein